MRESLEFVVTLVAVFYLVGLGVSLVIHTLVRRFCRPKRCTAIAYTNKPDRLIVRCRFPAGHRGSHLEDLQSK